MLLVIDKINILNTYPVTQTINTSLFNDAIRIKNFLAYLISTSQTKLEPSKAIIPMPWSGPRNKASTDQVSKNGRNTFLKRSAR